MPLRFTNTSETILVLEKIISYFVPFLILAIGLVGNTFSFMVFQFGDKSLRGMSSMVYLSFLAVIDTISLFIWNLDSFTRPNYGFELEDLNLPMCRVLSFLQYATLQSSAFIMSMLTVDRYFTVIAMPGSRVSRLPFSTPRTAFYWSIGIITTISLINFHMIIFNGPDTRNLTSNETLLQCYAPYGSLAYIFWDYVHLVLFCVIPFLLMLTFNSMLIVKVLLKSRSSTLTKGLAILANRQSSVAREALNRRLTISLLALTFMFIVLTLPHVILWTVLDFFIQDTDYYELVAQVAYALVFINQSDLFFVCFISHKPFRQSVINSTKRLLSKLKQAQKYSTSTVI